MGPFRFAKNCGTYHFFFVPAVTLLFLAAAVGLLFSGKVAPGILMIFFSIYVAYFLTFQLEHILPNTFKWLEISNG